ncbi:MAG: lipoyl(octanoyl) transferase LipB [Acidobacteria bacterium]|nr:lipoyl(octanoyl) transferase LipB [Acidobacteriota bacterium]
MELAGDSVAPSPEFSAGLAVTARPAAPQVSRREGAPKDSEPVCLGLDLGFRDYEESLRVQERIVARRKCGFLPDCLLFVDYPPIITLGRGGKREHLLAGPEELRRRGVRVYPAGRGGDITYHGPGQLVVYPVLDLKAWHRDIHRYLRTLERCLVEMLLDFGIPSETLPGATGVWVEGRKIGAIGVRTSNWVTSHGLALNVNTDLRYFDLIVPCGLVGRGVTSMAAQLGRSLELSEVRSCLIGHFARTFGRSLRAAGREETLVESWPAEAEPPHRQ